MYKFNYLMELEDVTIHYFTSALFDSRVYPVDFIEKVFSEFTERLSADKSG